MERFESPSPPVSKLVARTILVQMNCNMRSLDAQISILHHTSPCAAEISCVRCRSAERGKQATFIEIVFVTSWRFAIGQIYIKRAKKTEFLQLSSQIFLIFCQLVSSRLRTKIDFWKMFRGPSGGKSTVTPYICAFHRIVLQNAFTTVYWTSEPRSAILDFKFFSKVVLCLGEYQLTRFQENLRR